MAQGTEWVGLRREMGPETENYSQLEIAHVLFTDIVGYSKKPIDQQSELLGQLNQVVRGTEQFRAAEAAGKLVRLPTGDGMALAFFTSVDAPVRCALEIAEALKSRPKIQLRMGVDSGPVDQIVDVNDRPNVAGWAPLLAALAALSILIGNLVALAQSNVRRLLAYSAVAHAGYTLLGLVAGGRDGFSATLFYTTTYAFTLVGAFGVVALVRRETGGDDFSHFSGLRQRSPWLAACMAVFMLSLAGIPPLAGFFGKFYLFSAALRVGGNHGLLWLVALALFGSLISFYYYLMVLKVIFVGKTAGNVPPLRVDFLQRSSIALLAVIVLFLGLFPGGLVWKITSSLP